MNFLPLSASLIAGIYSSQYIPHFTAILFSLFFVVLSFITFRANRKFRIDAIFTVLFFVMGLFLYSFNSNPESGDEYEDCYVTLHGVVCSLPYERNGTNHYTVYADKIEFDGKCSAFKQKVNVNSDESFNCGDTVTLTGQLKRITDEAANDVFISKNYYASKNIFFKTTALSMSPSNEKCRYFSLPFYGNIIRSKCAMLIRTHFKGDIAAAMIAIFTGDKHGFSDEYNNILEHTSTRHLFYPAYIHITLMSLFIGLFSSLIPRRIRDFSLVMMLGVYAVFAVSPSGLKTASVMIVLILCKNIFGSGTYMNSLSLFLLIIGIIEPMAFFNAGFVYSVASTVIIRTFSQLLYGKSAITRFFGKYLIFTAGLAPFSLYLFGKISLYSFLASFIFMPILGLILVISPLFMLCLAKNFIYPFVWLVEKYIMFLLHIPILIDYLPFSYISLPKPSLAFIAAYYSAAAAIWYAHKRLELRKRICLAISLGLICSQLIYFVADFNKLELHFIDVGQADAALLQLRARSNIIIDGGGAPDYSSYNIGENVFVPYLSKHGATVIQAAFLTHYHKDHAEGIIAALKSLDVKNLFMPDVYPENEIRIELETIAMERGTKIHYISRPMRIRIDEIIIDVIPPSETVLFAGSENDMSLFINVQYGKFNALFTGDMTHLAEAQLLASGLVPEAEVLKIPHHGSATSSSEEFIKAVNPGYSLIGVVENNEYEHPHKVVLSRIRDSKILRTDQLGDIVLYADKNADIKIK